MAFQRELVRLADREVMAGRRMRNEYLVLGGLWSAARSRPCRR